MNRKLLLATYFILLGLLRSSLVFAQTYPIDAQAILIPPYSLDLSSYQVDQSQNLMLNLTLNDPTEPFWDVRLRLTISNNGTEILQTSPGFDPSPLRLNQFATITYTGFELSEYLAFENLVGINGYTYDGTLPEGLNSFCFEVVDYNRPGIVLSRKACASGYAVLNDPPFPNLPTCGEDVSFQQAQNITFNWMPMHYGSPNPVTNFEYEFTLVRVESGYNEFEAMESATPIHQETTTNTTLILQDPILEGGYTYAWRVQVVDAFTGDPLTSFKNDGYSVVCTFSYQQEEEMDLSDYYGDYEASECAAACTAEVPTNSEIITDLSVGDVVQIGKFFMNVSEISSSNGGFYGGKGYIFIPFLLSNMNVTFDDMTVNTEGVVYSGDIVTDIDSESLTDEYTDTGSELTIDADAIAAINEEVESEGRQVNQMPEGSSLGLPIALDNTIGGVTTNFIITGISFDTDIAYLNAVMSFGSAAGGDLIAFGATGICFHPYGIGGGEASLFLNEDFSLSNAGLDLTFLAPGDGNPGTFVTVDCNGFQELNIEGQYEFPDDMLARADGSGEPVAASFNINTTEWGQFIADVTFDEFEVVGVDGYTFSIDQAYLDFSDLENPEDIDFPEDYDDTEEDWVGFYLASATMTFPEDLAQSTGDISLGVQNVIIDHSGVSANIFAAGLLEIDNGRLGEWAFSIDTVQIDIVSNALTEGSLLGQIHVPIMDEENALSYAAVMAESDDGLDLLFTIQTEDDVSVSMWAAELSLSGSSVIAIEKTDEGFTPYAELHGDITLNLEIQEGNNFEIEAMSFEGLKINHPDESSRIAVDAFSLFGGGNGLGGDDDEEEEEGEDEQESLAGFPISMSNVAFVEGSGDEAEINFDLNINLTGDDLGVAGTANLTVTGEYDAAGAPFNAWSFQGVELSSVDVAADVAAGSIEGSISIYDGDQTYGDGFKGLLSAQFTGVGQVDALAQFGKVNGFRYFFVDALVLSQSPFIDILGIGLYGFGGGMYYHMSRDDADPGMNLEEGSLYAEPNEIGASLSGIRYVPNDETLIGMKATMIMGIAPGTGFSADATLEMSFGLNNNVPSIESIAMGGAAYMMSPGTILNREESSAIGQFDANLDMSDPDDPIFTATAQMTLSTEAITGSGLAAMRLAGDDYYLWIGTPDNPISIRVADVATFTAYMDIGTEVPDMPEISDIIPEYRGSSRNQRPTTLGGSQIIFGAGFELDKQSYSFGSFYASAEFGMGFDAYLRQVIASSCGAARGTIGMDSWYLSGQAYAYGEGNVGIKVDTWFYEGKVNILDLEASMVIQAELPNPTWLYGEVDIRYNILSGAIKGDVEYEFEIGEQCNFLEDPLAGIIEISDMVPEDGETNVSVLTAPTIAVNLPLNESFTIDALEDDGSTTTYYYMPVVQSFTLQGGTSQTTLEVAEDGETAQLYLDHIMDPFTEYTARASVRWKTKTEDGPWTWVANSTESKEVTFTTGDLPEYLPEEAVEITFPLANQRNMYDRASDDPFTVYVGSAGWDYLFENTGDFDYKLVIEDLTDGSSKRKALNYSEDSETTWVWEQVQFGDTDFYYWQPTLKTRTMTILSGSTNNWNNWVNDRNGHIFRCSIVGVYKAAADEELTVEETTETVAEGVQVVSNEITSSTESAIEDVEIYEWYFRMSDYNTPEDKLDDFVKTAGGSSLGITSAVWNGAGSRVYSNNSIEVNTYNQYGNFSTGETLDKYERLGYSFDYLGDTYTFAPTFEVDRINWTSNSDLVNEWKAWYNTMEDLYENQEDLTFYANMRSSWTQLMGTFNFYDEYPRYGLHNKFLCFGCYTELTTGEKESGTALTGGFYPGISPIWFTSSSESLLNIARAVTSMASANTIPVPYTREQTYTYYDSQTRSYRQGTQTLSYYANNQDFWNFFYPSDDIDELNDQNWPIGGDLSDSKWKIIINNADGSSTTKTLTLD